MTTRDMPMVRKGSVLHRLAERAGIEIAYIDRAGREMRACPDETMVALLAAMGFAASTEEEARASLEELDGDRSDRLLDPARVVVRRDGPGGAADRHLPGWHELLVRMPPTDGTGERVEWSLVIEEEDGSSQRAAGSAELDGRGRLAIALNELPGFGYHTLRLRVQTASGALREGEQFLIVTPPRCFPVDEYLQHERVWGVTANLYAVRTSRNWGVGDLTDLRAMLEWTASLGGAFVGVNPLHALRNRGWDISPYSPVSRLYRNVLYIDVEAVPELPTNRAVADQVRSPDFRERLARSREGDRVDYEAVMALKRPVLEALHRDFIEHHLGIDDGRAAAYAAYLHREGEPLTDFATFCALEEVLAGRLGKPLYDWREWPAEYQDARGEAVRDFREQYAERVDFHRWLQFEVDCQLAKVAETARHVRLPIGLYQDLAIGSAPNGTETWAMPNLFAHGATIGAPPDPLGPQGQNWGLPPINPYRLEADGYRYWTRLVRAAFSHSGALRIDHIMGLFRGFWIPEGKSAREGAYVRYPSEPLLGILALESARARAIVVGEDLGTVPPDVPPALERWGILSSKVLYFERDQGGAFLPATTYPRSALATANTHDLATLRGFWEGRDIEIRRSVGILPSDRDVAEEQRRREVDRAALVARLTSDGLLAPGATLDRATIRTAVHAFLRRTPCWLVGFSLDDIADERDTVNVPGTSPATYPSWSRRMDGALEEIMRMRGLEVQRVVGVERVSETG